MAAVRLATSRVIFSTTLQGLCCFWLVMHQFQATSAVLWEEWWTYEGISGPAFWGLINPEWSLCSRGRRQSPINLEPSQLLFDPNLRPLHIDKHKFTGYLSNVGHGIVFTVDNSTKPSVNITGGPLSYRYEFHQIAVHFGIVDSLGSEHTIAGKSFPAELQIFGFNSQLYSTYAEAMDSPHGIVGISVLMQIGDSFDSQLRFFTDHLSKIEYAGQEVQVGHFSLRDLLPETEHFITYEGSSTMPACQETVTWIVANKPLYISKQQLYALRKLRQGSPGTESATMGNNFRPSQPSHNRPIRTNIDFTAPEGKSCVSMHKDMHYRANSAFWQP